LVLISNMPQIMSTKAQKHQNLCFRGSVSGLFVVEGLIWIPARANAICPYSAAVCGMFCSPQAHA
jgi:hypothetical protein